MVVFLRTFLLFILFFPVDGLTVHKCCKLGYALKRENKQYKCVVTTSTTNSSTSSDEDDLSWFPHTELYDGAMVKLSEEQQLTVMKRLKTRWTVQYGDALLPKCDPSKIEVSYVNKTRKLFKILVKGEEGEEHVDVIPTFSHLIDRETLSDTMWILPLDDVCLDKISGKAGYTMLVYCPHSSSSKPWIRKCCPLGQLLYGSKCVPFPAGATFRDWTPDSMTGELRKFFLHFTRNPSNSKIPQCDAGYDKWRDEVKEIRCESFLPKHLTFLSNGSIELGDRTLTTDEYCGERTWHSDRYFENNLVYCKPQPLPPPPQTLYGVLFLLGGFCLLATVAISLVVPELRQNAHNMITITHNATLMAAHFLWGAKLLVPTEELSARTCIVLCVVIQFTFLGSLFWLNALCIIMSSTFRKTRQVRDRSPRNELKRYGKYSAYAWGLTALVSIFTVAMETSETTPFGFPRPGFTCRCDFARETISVFVYFYGPMTVLLFSNTVLYVLTVWKIMGVSRQVTSVLHKKDSRTTGGSTMNSDRDRLIVYTKLFLIMGLTWMTEIIGWVVDREMTAYAFWIALDVINLLRAAFIFIIFICQRPVLRNLRAILQDGVRHCWFRSYPVSDTLALSTVTNLQSEQDLAR